MEDKLINFQTAILAKEKGFNEPTLHHWEEGVDDMLDGLYTSGDLLINSELTPTYIDNRKPGKVLGEFSAPTQSLLQKWLREIHFLNIEIMFGSRSWNGFAYYHGHVHRGGDGIQVRVNYGEDDFYPETNLSYEECLDKLLFEALKIIKIKNKN